MIPEQTIMTESKVVNTWMERLAERTQLSVRESAERETRISRIRRKARIGMYLFVDYSGFVLFVVHVRWIPLIASSAIISACVPFFPYPIARTLSYNCFASPNPGSDRFIFSASASAMPMSLMKCST